MSHRYRQYVFLLITVISAGCCKESDVPAALSGLYAREPRERNRSLQVLAQCPAMAESAVPRITSLMYDSNVGVASSAAYALRRIDSKEARQALKLAEEARSRQRGAK